MTGDSPDQTDVVTVEEPQSTAAEPESSVEQEPTAGPAATGKRRLLPGLRQRLTAVVLALLLVASAGVAAWLYYFQYRPDQQTDVDAREVVLEAAKTGTVALLSYSPETLDQDFASAKSRLTGEFLDYYTQFTEQIVTPAARDKEVTTSATVMQAAVAEMQPDSAVVLAFVNQNTVSKDNPEGAFGASAVKVGMTKSDGRWLINAFDPV